MNTDKRRRCYPRSLVFICGQLLLLSVLVHGAPAEDVLDRIAVVIGDKDVITETEMLLELRLASLLNGEPADATPEARRKAAERLIEQNLIRREMSISRYSEPPASEAEKMLAELKQKRFKSDAEYRRALEQYRVTEEELKAHLLWQLAALRFTDVRFRLAATANGVNGHTDGAQNGVDRQLDAWLKEARNRTRIEFRKEAFQ